MCVCVCVCERLCAQHHTSEMMPQTSARAYTFAFSLPPSIAGVLIPSLSLSARLPPSHRPSHARTGAREDKPADPDADFATRGRLKQ